jgi:hypothetical protein
MTPADKPPIAASADARRANRERTLLPGRISFGDGILSMECIVMQLSESGARIKLPPGVSLPDRFHIAIPQREVNCHARLIWRKTDQAAVEFAKPASGPSLTSEPDQVAKLRQLEAEHAALRAKVAELMAKVKRLTEE